MFMKRFLDDDGFEPSTHPEHNSIELLSIFPLFCIAAIYAVCASCTVQWKTLSKCVASRRYILKQNRIPSIRIPFAETISEIWKFQMPSESFSGFSLKVSDAFLLFQRLFSTFCTCASESFSGSLKHWSSLKLSAIIGFSLKQLEESLKLSDGFCLCLIRDSKAEKYSIIVLLLV